MSWNKLPTEVRRLILEKLTHDECLPRIASTCREWQKFIEPITFRQLTVNASRIRSLASVADLRHRGRRALVKYMHLCIRHPRGRNSTKKIREWLRGAAAIEHHSLPALLAIIGEWGPGNLTLDISVNHSADLRHHHHPSYSSNRSRADDTVYGWIGAARVSLDQTQFRVPRAGHKDGPSCRLNTHFLKPSRFPRPVDAVTSLIIRRQNQHWSPHDISYLVGLLPRLRDLHFEYWRSYCGCDFYTDWSMLLLLFECLKMVQLKSVVLFEDFNHSWLNYHSGRRNRDPGPLQPKLSANLAQASLRLERLAVSFGFDAAQIFQSLESKSVWEKLVSLTLTDQDLVPDSHDNVTALLHDTALRARNMPKIEVIQLWNHRSIRAKDVHGHETMEKSICLFTYRVSRSERRAYLVWKANWDYDLDPEVVQAWRVTANEYHALVEQLQVEQERLSDDLYIRCHGDTIHILGLHHVIHPLSLWQIRREHARVVPLMDRNGRPVDD